MKKSFLILYLIPVLWLSCTNNQDNNSSKNTQQPASEADTKNDAVENEKLLVLPWTAVYNEQTEKLEMQYNESADMENLTVRDMIDAANLKYPETRLYTTGQHGDTLEVTINDPVYLTQQSGTAGAEIYLAEVTFALTEFPDVKVVNFHFKEGDHAVPKAYTRESFKGFN